MTGLYEEPDDATPLTREEREGLFPSHVTLRSELNELEQQNIVEAEAVIFGRRVNPMTEAFARRLHRQMFSKVWKWAGKYRTSNKNLGVNYYEIQPELIGVFDNVQYWIEHDTYAPDEIGVRFHRDIVWIHPFANGNGRWSRLMADLLVVRLCQPRFTWGGSALRDPDQTRRAYIDSLRTADQHDYRSPIHFARS